ncbi:MAG: DUF2461 domain-containing protein [Clostridia bacterium]|nr:DUF2461 domain-containing protein [Clostridia bacterium]
MKYKYDGITRDMLFLMADNRFRNSKAFYDAHKEEMKAGITVPLRQIAEQVVPDLLKLDEKIVSIPVKMVSRFRRDTRFTKDQSLYRDHMWIMFMRDKHAFTGYPAFWFEITPSAYSMGVGMFMTSPAQMNLFRKHLREKTAAFKKAAAKCEKNGSLIYGSEYKRMPADCPPGLEPYYGRKEFGFIKYSDSLDDLSDERIIDIVKSVYKDYSDMFGFLFEIAEEFNLGKEED